MSTVLAFVALLAVLTGCGGGTPSSAAAAAVDESQRGGGCGNGVCAGKETCATCPNDCGACIFCGDGACNGDETCATCTADCGTCPTSCGDGSCNGEETCDDCATDCGACPTACGDGVCGRDETCTSCAGDCGACPATPACGDGTCNGTETCTTCAADCGACAPTVSCGDGTCNGTETCTTCAGDCGACPPTVSCGDGTCNGAETCTTCAGDCGACAPSTGRIAFVSDRSGTWRIYLANADGSGVTPLTAGEAPAWSANGRKIAFHRAGSGIYVIDADGANERFLRAGGFFPTWSPDDANIAFGGAGGISVMNADGSNPHLLISHDFESPAPGYYNVQSPAWSPDGRTIAFVRASYEEGWAIYTIDADGSGSPSPIPTGWAENSPAWSPNGSRIAFETAGMMIDPDTRVQYSADQVASVAFPSRSDFEVHVTDGSRLGADYIGDPAWSPDGRSLLFVRSSPLGTPTRIFIVTEDGSVRQAIPEARSPAKADYWDREPAWSWAD